MSGNTVSARRYTLLEVIGRGGYGTVYRAELTGAGSFAKQVAVKVLHRDFEGATVLVARLRDEARMLGLLRHRAIVRVDGLVKLDGRWAVVMEYVDGATGDEIRDQAHVPVSVALGIVEEVAAALHVAWTTTADGRPLRLMHRDVKPSNLKVAADGTVKLLDFGIARADFDAREARTQSTLLGSRPFMAPERLSLKQSDRSDVFALAVTLVELLAGVQDTTPVLNPKKHEERVVALTVALREVVGDDDLVMFVRRCLAFEPHGRPDAATMAREIRAIRERFPVVHLADWAAETVGMLEKRRSPIPDPLLGCVLVEEIQSGDSAESPHRTFIMSDDEVDLHSQERGVIPGDLYAEDAPVRRGLTLPLFGTIAFGSVVMVVVPVGFLCGGACVALIIKMSSMM